MSPPHARPPPRHARQQWVGAAALLCAVAYLGTAAHYVLVQHVTCAAHGELVHATEAPAQLRVSRRLADARVVVPDQAPDAGHDADAHCAAAHPRRELPCGIHTLPRPALGAAVLSAAPARLTPAEPIARLHLAPKASPPAV